MATVAALNIEPTTVPLGGSADITVTFNVAQANTYEVKLYENGVERVAGSLTFQGELPPTVLPGNLDEGWEIRATGGTLVSNGPNRFTLSA